jgi:hypothetical protein
VSNCGTLIRKRVAGFERLIVILHDLIFKIPKKRFICKIEKGHSEKERRSKATLQIYMQGRSTFASSVPSITLAQSNFANSANISQTNMQKKTQSD